MDSVDVAMSVEGQVSRAEAAMLAKLAQDVPRGDSIVEIGTYRGRSAVALALGARVNGNRVYAVDPHTDFRGVRRGHFGPEDMSALYANLSKAGVGETVAVVCLPSLAAAEGWANRNIGLLWIDGDHRYESVRADFDAWMPFTTGQCVVAFHDVKIPGVERLLDEVLRSGALELCGTVGVLSWLRRK